MILEQTLPPAGRLSYNICDFDKFTSLMASGSSMLHANATAVFPSNIRLEATQDLRSLETFLSRIGNENIPKVRSILVDLGDIPPLDQLLDGAFGLLVRRVFHSPGLVDLLYFHTSSSAYASRQRLETCLDVMHRALGLAVIARECGVSEVELREKYLQWRMLKIETLGEEEGKL